MMLSVNRASKLIFISIFMFMISAPLLGRLFHAGATSADDFTRRENRSPHHFPKLPRTTEKLADFPAVFEKAFNDHVSFREFFIESYSHMMVGLLKASPNRQLLIGKNGHFFLATHLDGDNDLIFSSIQMDTNTLSVWEKGLIANESFLKDLGVPVLLLAIPTSPLFEFHNLPLFIQRQTDPSFLTTPPPQRIIDRVPRSLADRYLLFPYERAVEANRKFPLFGEKDFHWRTSRYTKLVASCIAERFGVAPYEDPGFDEFEERATVSDLSRFAGIEVYNRKVLAYKNGFWESLGIRDKNPADVYPGYPVSQHSFYTVNPSKGGKILLVGNSFAPALRFDLARHFGEVLSIDFNQARTDARIQEWFDAAFLDYQPDYVVFCCHNTFFIYPEFVSHFYLVKQRADTLGRLHH